MDVVQVLLDTLLQGNFVFQIKLPINLSDDAALNEIVTDVIRDAMHTIINKLDQNIKNKNLPPLEDDTSAGSGEDESSEDDDSDKEEEKTLISGLNIPNVLFAVKRLFYSIQGPPIFAESELARKIRNIIKFKIKHFVLTSQLEKGMDILNERERHILTERRLKDKATTLEDLSRFYDVSRERIRQIEVRAFEKLQKSMKNSKLEQRMKEKEMRLQY